MARRQKATLALEEGMAGRLRRSWKWSFVQRRKVGAMETYVDEEKAGFEGRGIHGFIFSCFS